MTSIWFIGLCVFSYATDENTGIKKGPSPDDMEKARRVSEQQRPILPPVISSAPFMMSPTPSPQITATQMPPQVINQPNFTPHVPQPSGMQNIPSMPTYAAPPIVPMPLEIPQAPAIGNTIGKVMNKGSEKDGSLWLEVNDNVFDQLIRVNIRNLKSTPIVRQAQMYKFSDIKIGDTVNAMYHTENDDNVANFINVMTQEEIEMWNQPAANPDLTVTPKKDNTQPEKQ